MSDQHVELFRAAKLVLATLRRTNRLPARLDEEEHEDLVQEGVLAGMSMLRHYDAQRGSVEAYVSKAMLRAMLRYAWRSASCGLTGEHGGDVQIWPVDDNTAPLDDDELHPDIAGDDDPAGIVLAEELAETL